MLLQKEYRTRCGVIHYWIAKKKESGVTLVFLPGLTADHHLFDKQIAYFEGKYSVFVWDAPERVNRLIEELVIRCETEITPEKREEER